MPRTKIVATIGPASNSEEMIRVLIDAGMNVARVNFSHLEKKQEAIDVVNRLRKVAVEMNYPLAILGDLQGPKLRLGKIPNDWLTVVRGQKMIISAEDAPDSIPFPHPELFPAIEPGARLVLGDGEVELNVLSKNGLTIEVESAVNGKIGSRKGVSLPGTSIPVSSITDKDQIDIVTICELDLDFIALSFVRSADDICELRDLMNVYGKNIPIIAKIEKSEAIEELDAIRDAADGMMVARGDLGIDLPPQEVPFLQKRIIRTCNEVGKPVITATQMLQSMVDNPVPTRAEATDVANAILDGTDAVMLSNETAMGQYPERSVKMMRDIAGIAEENFPFDEWNERRRKMLFENKGDVAEAISSSAVGAARYLNLEAIVANTVSGYTARQVARYRPEQPVIALTPVEATRRRLNLVWGIETMSVPRYNSMDEIFNNTTLFIARSGRFKPGNRIAITAGTPFARTGLTNLLQVHEFTEDEFKK